jgi:hypothetical protein
VPQFSRVLCARSGDFGIITAYANRFLIGFTDQSLIRTTGVGR